MREDGLSLLETLIALAVMAIILGGLSLNLNFALNVFQRSDQVSAYHSAFHARVQLRAHLKHAVLPDQITQFDESFMGNDTSLRFLSLLETPFEPRAAATEVRVEYVDDILTMKLILLDFNGNIMREDELELLKQTEAVRFQYFGGRIDEQWSEIWAETVSLPKLISIEAVGKSEPDWPEFTVALPKN